MSSDPFWPLLLYLSVVVVVVAVMIIMPSLLGERHRRKSQRENERGTAEPYESGIAPTGTAKLRVPVQYYLVAMLFVIFDVEAVYLYGWALVAREAGWLGFVEAAVFIGILLAALAYLWRVGALDWTVQRRRLRPRQSQSTTQEDPRAMVA
ncbi:MAG TPA: NADH-quinone oxidoreductase subunit A [Nitrospiraceae bacterium]|nr:NADH-quinone oxidoreductase subunit A [Nitrospiraceae bacterium]